MTSRDRRALVLGSFLAVAAFTGRCAWDGIGQVTQTEGRVEVRRLALASATEAIRRLDRLEDSAAALQAAVTGLAPQLLSGSSESEAVAALARVLSATASRAAARVEGMTPVPDSGAAGRLRRAAIRATLATDFRGLASILESIRRHPVALGVATIEVTVADPTAQAGPPAQLQARISVFGWFLER